MKPQDFQRPQQFKLRQIISDVEAFALTSFSTLQLMNPGKSYPGQKNETHLNISRNMTATKPSKAGV